MVRKQLRSTKRETGGRSQALASARSQNLPTSFPIAPQMPTHHTETHAHKRDVFLSLYREHGNISHACRALKMSRRTLYDWREDPAFEKAFQLAKQEALERVEEELHRRAVEGVEKPVFYRGKQVGAIREYSDVLLIFYLKSLAPEKYRDVLDHRHLVAGKVVHQYQPKYDLSKLSVEELEQYTRLLEKIEQDGHELTSHC